MSAPVTEAHLELANTVIFSRDSKGRLLTAPMAAQIIADSEARAINAAFPDSGDDSLYNVRRLRAEVERLKKQIKDDNRSYGCELRDPYGTIWEQATKDHDRAGKAERALAELREWQAGVIANERLHHAERKDAIARAERAEAELDGIRALADRRNKRYHVEDTTHQLVAALDQALDIAQAELAAERARLDWLLSRMGGNVLPANKCVAWTVDVYHYGNRFPSRAAIDAAMKGGAK